MPTNVRFIKKKEKILASLQVPDAEYTDLSPKGIIDEGIRELIDVINSNEGFVTTSSCAGRVSVFLEGKKKSQIKEDRVPVNGDVGYATPGGKGGGKWLFVSHDPVCTEPPCGQPRKDLVAKFGMTRSTSPSDTIPPNAPLVHFKFEPMVKTASPA